jgi:alpha-tubulin suppressor-like RCC1 family protein
VGFGGNSGGQLGLGDNVERNIPTAIPALGTSTVDTVESCAAGNFHNLCRKLDGSWLVWGLNYDGNLGLVGRL